MKNTIYIFLLTTFVLFQLLCKSTKSIEDPTNVNNVVITENKSDKKKEQTVNVSDTSVLAKEYFKDEPFPVVIMGMSNKNRAFSEVKEWGVTHVHRYGMGKSIENDQAFFDRAEKYGLKVMSDLRARYWLKGDKDLENFSNYINHFKDHPALGFWYLIDEPDNKGIEPSELLPLYKLVKEESFNTPIANAHAWTKKWGEYGKVQDILMYDYYPVYAKSFPEAKLTEWSFFSEIVAEESKGDDNLVFPIIQIFNWKAFANQDLEKFRGYSVEDLRYPNTEELRYMVYSSIAKGAKGIALFSYWQSKKVDPYWGGETLTPVIKEVKAFTKQIDIGKRNEYIDDDKNLVLASWQNANSKFLVLINGASNARSVNAKLDTYVENIEEYRPWGQTRNNVELSYTEGQLAIEKMKPWEVVVLKRGD